MYYSSSLLFVGVFLVLGTGANVIPDNESEARIIGGAAVAGGLFDNFPYTVSIQFRNRQSEPTRGHHCGGALISNRDVLTIATCVTTFVNLTHFDVHNANLYRIFVGSVFLNQDTSARVRNVASITVHPNFDATSFFNDLAILRTNSPFTLVDHQIDIVPLRVQPLLPLQYCTLTGWGGDQLMTVSDRMHALTAQQHNHFECGEAFNSTRLVGDGSVCASSSQGSAPCTFDLGGPLVCDGQLSGVLNYAAHCDIFPGAPSVYVRIEPYTAWISTTLASGSLVSGQTSFLLLSAAIFFQLFHQLKKFE